MWIRKPSSATLTRFAQIQEHVFRTNHSRKRSTSSTQIRAGRQRKAPPRPWKSLQLANIRRVSTIYSLSNHLRSCYTDYGIDLQTSLIQAIQALAGVGVISNDQVFATTNSREIDNRETPQIANPDSSSVGNCTLVQQTGFFGVEHFLSDNKTLSGFMGASISIPTLAHGFCGDVANAIKAGSVASAIPGVGGVFAELFGVVNAACSDSH
jgi:hypothetical protein